MAKNITNQQKVRENRLRRLAKRRGYELHKHPARNPEALDYGLWTIVDLTGVDRLSAGMTLDEVERRLAGLSEREEARKDTGRVVHRVLVDHPDVDPDRLYALTRQAKLDGCPDEVDALVTEVARRLEAER